ncbi:N-acetyltransferase [Spirochaetia bacterium]|nr:N-acetyltransferase [Synergistales bacterium]GHV90963.1 N-acetyltransferase [Spirochaetia bacterium]
MSSLIPISRKNGTDYFYMEKLGPGAILTDFFCPIEEYNEYLTQDALRSQDDHVALTWLLQERASKGIVAYMSIINDAIKLSVSEKELHNLNYPFKTIPAMKIAKLAVSQSFREKYKGIGSFMIDTAINLALECNVDYSACRFLTVDADIENNESVLTFYEKNGFILNNEMNNKNRKTISMRKDIFA